MSKSTVPAAPSSLNSRCGTVEPNTIQEWRSPLKFTVFEQDRAVNQGSVEVFIERPDVERFDFKVGGYYFQEEVDTQFCFDVRGNGTTRP